MAQNDKLYVRIDKKIRDDAERIFTRVGVTPSQAVRLFYQKVINSRGGSFTVDLNEVVQVEDKK